MIKENLKCAIKKKTVANRTFTEIDLEGFRSLSELEKVEIINEYPNKFRDKYENMTSLLLEDIDEYGDGLVKQAPFDAIKSSNSSKVSDVTAELGTKLGCLKSMKVEKLYDYGENEVIDRIIDLERALKLYYAIIRRLDSKIGEVLKDRLRGADNSMIAQHLLIDVDTVSHYVTISKKFIPEIYEEIMDEIRARETIRKSNKKEG